MSNFSGSLQSRALFFLLYILFFPQIFVRVPVSVHRPPVHPSNNSLIKDATSSSKVATLDEKVASLEPKDTKVIVFCRKDDFPSLFRGKLANFVCVFTL